VGQVLVPVAPVVVRVCVEMSDAIGPEGVLIREVMLAGAEIAVSPTQNRPTRSVGEVVVVTEGATAVRADAPLAPTTSTAVPPLTAIIDAVRVSQLYPPDHTKESVPVATRV
jgi:hypothetical protein